MAAARRLVPRAGDAGTARLEAEVLLAHVLGTSRGALLRGDPIRDADAERFEVLVTERAERARPVAYITGHQPFLDLDLLVDERVLVPRPETEGLVEAYVRREQAGDVPAGPVLDRGTGSGAIALGLPAGRRVLATDLSEGALEVARLNVERCGADDRVRLARMDGLDGVGDGCLAAVLANPPYVEPEEHATLAPDVTLWEPREALVPARGTVTDVYAALVTDARRVLRPGGWLLTEVGLGQAGRVAGLMEQAGFLDVVAETDLAGIDRVVCGRLSSAADPR